TAVEAIALLDLPKRRHRYDPVRNSLTRSLSFACSRVWARCRRWLRIDDKRVGSAEGGVVSSCGKAVPDRIVGDPAARLPSCSDQARAACCAVSFSLSRFIVLAFACV